MHDPTPEPRPEPGPESSPEAEASGDRPEAEGAMNPPEASEPTARQPAGPVDGEAADPAADPAADATGRRPFDPAEETQGDSEVAETPGPPEAAERPEPPAPAQAPVDRVGVAARALREQLLLTSWTNRAGVGAALLLGLVALALLVGRMLTADAPWVEHLVWLAWGILPLGWWQFRHAARHTPSVERLRSRVERGARRRDDAPEAALSSTRRVPLAGMLAAGGAALLVLLASAVPVAQPRLERAAATVSRGALAVQDRAEVLREAGLLGVDELAALQAQVRELSLRPATEAEAELRRVALSEMAEELENSARRTARAATERLASAEVASALAEAFDLNASAEPAPAFPETPSSLEEPFGANDEPPAAAGAEPPSESPAGASPADDPLAVRRAALAVLPEPGLSLVPLPAPPSGPGGLPPGACGALATLLDEAMSGPAGLSEFTSPLSGRLTVPDDLRNALWRADRLDEPPLPEHLQAASTLLIERRARLSRLIQRLEAGGFTLERRRASFGSGTGGDTIDPIALREALQDAGRLSAPVVTAAADRLR